MLFAQSARNLHQWTCSKAKVIVTAAYGKYAGYREFTRRPKENATRSDFRHASGTLWLPCIILVQLVIRTAEPVISSDWNNMLDLTLRQGSRGERLKGTTIDFSDDKPTSALQQTTTEFLSITYPSVDLLRVFEATQPDKSRPVVLLSGRGQGKSHLMAALWHAIKDPAEATKWLADWATRLNRPELKTLSSGLTFLSSLKASTSND